MGYRIDYLEQGGTLAAVVRGRSSRTQAAWIARDIAGEAGRQSAHRLLIDLRGLVDRVGTLSALLMAPAAARERRVAVLDAPDQAFFYAFAEAAACACGYSLRFFGSASAALEWLAESRVGAERQEIA